MARTSTVRLSITSAFDSKGTRAAESAMKSFEKSAAAVGGSSAFASGMAAKSVALEQFGTKAINLGTKVTAAGKTLTKGLTVPIVAAGAASVAAASNMESAFANVKKTVDATDEEYQRLYESAIELSKAHPISAADVAMIQSLGAQLGISTTNLDSFAETVYGLDIATDLDAETAATQLAQFANICGTTETELSNVGSTVVALGNTSATTESTIMGLGMRLAASGTQAGMSEANVLAVSAALASLGMEAEAGGTAMSKTLNQISVDVAKNSDNMQTWASLAGQSVDEFAANWAAGGDVTTQTFASVVEGMARTTDEGGNLTILLDELGITGIRQSDAMKRLASSGDLLTTSINTANTAYAENSALTDEVANFEDTFASKLEVTKNKMTAVAIEAGGPLMDALAGVLDATEPLIQAVAEAANSFANMDEGGQRTIITVLAAAAAIGPLTIGTGKLITAVGHVSVAAGKVAGKLATWSVASKATAAAEATTETATKKSTTAIHAKTAATRTMTTVSAAAKVAVAGLAIAGIMALVSSVSKAIEKQKTYTQATEGLIAATKNTVTASDSASLAVGELGASAQRTVIDVDKLVESQAQLAEQISATNSTAQADVAVLEQYQNTINELANKSNLSAEEQANLELAIQAVNSATGSAYSVAGDLTGQIYDQNGALLENVDAINQVIDAKQRQIQIEAHESNYRALVETRISGEEQLAAAILRTEQARKNLSEAEKEGVDDLGSLVEGLRVAEEKQGQLEEAVNAATIAEENEAKQMNLLQQASDGSTSAIGQFVASQSLMQATLKASGQDMMQFQTHLETTGVSTEQLSTLTDDQLTSMAASYDGSITSIETSLAQYGIDAPSAAQAAASGIRTLTEAELNALPDTVQGIADGTIANYNGGLYKYDGASARWIAQLSKDAVNGLPGSFSGVASGAVGEFNGQLYRYDGKSGKWVAEKAKAEADSVDMGPSGYNFSSGFAGGITSGVSLAVNAAADMATRAIKEAKAKLDERSPSRVMRASGVNFTHGFALGVEAETDFAAAKATSMVGDTIAAAQKAAVDSPELMIDTTFRSHILKNPGTTGAAKPTTQAAVIAQSTFDDSRIVSGIALIGDKLDKVVRTLEQIRDRQMKLEINQREFARLVAKC